MRSIGVRNMIETVIDTDSEKRDSTRGRWLAGLQRRTGLDRAIAYTVMARVFQIVGSTGTVLLIVRFLSSVEQGYYYTLLSLVALQTVFELGFSFVIQQLAAHETVHLTLHPDGRIQGDRLAHLRLASVLQKTVRWYLLAGAVMLATLLPAGSVFFSTHAHAGETVRWHGPWIFAVIVTVALFMLNPVLSFLEGCGQVRQVAGMRLAQGIVAIAVPWSVLVAHRGLWSPGAVNAAYSLVALAFLWSRRKLLLPLLRHSGGANAIAWRTEIWPFQWRLGVSFLCSWFTAQIFTPVLFAYRGPVEAGRMGMSMSIAGYLWAVVLPWMSTKATPFGNFIARGEFQALDSLFFRTLKQSVALLAGIVALCWAGIEALQYATPRLAARMLPPHLFALLLLAGLSVFVVQSLAIYLRAHKREPFLWQSLLVAGLTSGGALLFIPHWGLSGAAITYFVCTGIVGLSFAVAIFRRYCRARFGKGAAALRRMGAV
jgi:O-antigen/teichoic acid export membrane protein